MTYSAARFQLTHLLQGAWYTLGQFKTWKATGGSQTTVVNSIWAGVEEQLFEDDDPSLIYGTVAVVRDAGGGAAAPEGELGMITDYDSSTYTLTMDTLTSGVDVGDKVGIASPLFPLDDMVRLANLALKKLGTIDIVDTSLSVATNQTEYTLPSTIRERPVKVRRQTLKVTNNNKWVLVPNTDIIPATAGSDWKLVIPPSVNGYSLEVTYRAEHPDVLTFDADIQNSVHPQLAIAALVAEAYQWYNNSVGGSNPYFLQRENKALQDLEAALVKFPIRHIPEQVSGLPHWYNYDNNYVPGTSDLRA